MGVQTTSNVLTWERRGGGREGEGEREGGGREGGGREGRKRKYSGIWASIPTTHDSKSPVT